MEQERPCALDLQLADQLGGLQLEGLAAPSQDENAWAAAAAAADVTPLPRARRRRAGGQPYTPLHMAATAAGGEAAVTPALMAVAPSTTPCTAGWATGQKPLTQAQRSLRNSVLKGCMGEVVEEAAAAEETPSAVSGAAWVLLGAGGWVQAACQHQTARRPAVLTWAPAPPSLAVCCRKS